MKISIHRNVPVFVAFLFAISFVTASDKDADSYNEETANYKEEYSHIFKSLPALFEYLIAALQDKPELLEKSDLMAFQDQHHGPDSIAKRSITGDFFKLITGRNDDKGFSRPSKLFGADEENNDGYKNEGDDETSVTSEKLEDKILMYEKRLEEHNEESEQDE